MDKNNCEQLAHVLQALVVNTLVNDSVWDKSFLVNKRVHRSNTPVVF